MSDKSSAARRGGKGAAWLAAVSSGFLLGRGFLRGFVRGFLRTAALLGCPWRGFLGAALRRGSPRRRLLRCLSGSGPGGLCRAGFGARLCSTAGSRRRGLARFCTGARGATLSTRRFAAFKIELDVAAFHVQV